MGKTIAQRGIFKLLFALVLGGAFVIAYNECLHKWKRFGPCLREQCQTTLPPGN